MGGMYLVRLSEAVRAESGRKSTEKKQIKECLGKMQSLIWGWMGVREG